MWVAFLVVLSLGLRAVSGRNVAPESTNPTAASRALDLSSIERFIYNMLLEKRETDSQSHPRFLPTVVKDTILIQPLDLVGTKQTNNNNNQRGKRYIQRSHLTPCLFKICNIGRKRHLL